MNVSALQHPKLESRRSSLGSQITNLVTPFDTDPLAVENEINDRLGAPNNTNSTEAWESAPITAPSASDKIASNLTPKLIDPVRP